MASDMTASDAPLTENAIIDAAAAFETEAGLGALRVTFANALAGWCETAPAGVAASA